MGRLGEAVVSLVICGVIAVIVSPLFMKVREVSGHTPSPFIRLCQEGNKLKQEGNSVEAAKKYEEALTLKPNSTRLRQKLIGLYEDSRNATKLQEHFRYLIRDPGTTDELTAERIVALIEGAKKHKVDTDPSPMIDRALARLKPNRLVHEMGFPEITWTTDPHSKRCALYTAASLQSLHTTNYHQALIRCRQAIEIDPENVPARVYAAYSATKAQKSRAEVEGYLKGVARTPKIRLALQAFDRP